MLNLGQNYHQKVPTGEKMTLITQDIENFRMGIGPGLLILFDAMIYVSALIPLMLMIDVRWTWQCLALMPLIPFVIYKLEDTLNKNYRQVQDETGNFTSFTQESVSGIKVIKSLGLNRSRLSLFNHTNSNLKKYGIRVDRLESAFGPSLEFFVMIGTATLLFVGADKVISGQISVGNFFAFYQYLLRMIWPMTALGFSFMMYKEADSSFDRIRNVLEKEHWIPDGQQLAEANQDLEIKNLSFKYIGAKSLALTNINFRLKHGQSMAVVGAVGSGKSTLVQILASSLPPTRGQVLYGNQPICDYDTKSYRAVATLIPQKVFLFKKSIKQNVLDFNNKSTEALDFSSSLSELLTEAHIYNEIDKMPLKEETLLEENGQGLSGGQRQRLALARGLALSPRWLIMDDSLSAIDIETEQKILRDLKSKKKNQIMNFIICSHRIQNLDWVDQILVLDKGRLIDIGDHKSLYERCDLYRNLYSSQKNGISEAISHKGRDRETLNQRNISKDNQDLQRE